jgi:hypothetical protein
MNLQYTIAAPGDEHSSVSLSFNACLYVEYGPFEP